MEGPLFSCKALEEDLCVGIDSEVAPRLGVGAAGRDGGISSLARQSKRAGSAAPESLHCGRGVGGQARADGEGLENGPGSANCSVVEVRR